MGVGFRHHGPRCSQLMRPTASGGCRSFCDSWPARRVAPGITTAYRWRNLGVSPVGFYLKAGGARAADAPSLSYALPLLKVPPPVPLHKVADEKWQSVSDANFVGPRCRTHYGSRLHTMPTSVRERTAREQHVTLEVEQSLVVSFVDR